VYLPFIKQQKLHTNYTSARRWGGYIQKEQLKINLFQLCWSRLWFSSSNGWQRCHYMKERCLV